MSYYAKRRNSWSGTNGYGSKIHNPDAYYAAVRENRYGFNSGYSEDQCDKYSNGRW